MRVKGEGRVRVRVKGEGRVRVRVEGEGEGEVRVRMRAKSEGEGEGERRKVESGPYQAPGNRVDAEAVKAHVQYIRCLHMHSMYMHLGRSPRQSGEGSRTVRWGRLRRCAALRCRGGRPNPPPARGTPRAAAARRQRRRRPAMTGF